MRVSKFHIDKKGDFKSKYINIGVNTLQVKENGSSSRCNIVSGKFDLSKMVGPDELQYNDYLDLGQEVLVKLKMSIERAHPVKDKKLFVTEKSESM